MNQIYEGCLVKCIKPNTNPRVPSTTIGNIYTVTRCVLGSYLKLSGADISTHNLDYRFDIDRFELYKEDAMAYPTLKKQYFNTSTHKNSILQ